MNSVAIDEAFAKTLLGEYDDDAPWEAVRELRRIATDEVFDRAVEWCRSNDPLKRARGVDVLAQFGRTPEHPSHACPQDSFLVIASLIKTEEELMPLSSGISALGHIGDARAVRLLSRFQNHSDAEIRFALACALGNFANDPTAANVLVQLMRDEDQDVRDWATFGIGTLGEKDSPEIREALIGRLSDSFEDVRQEAIAGLARLRDERVLTALLFALKQEDVPDIVIDAALDMLGLSESSTEWNPARCVEELRKRYSLSS
jgi:HEAT repeat protein